jgi:hypothetical protein
LAHSAFISVSTSKSSKVKEVSPRSSLPLGARLVPITQATGRCQISWQDHRIPPPGERIIALQHLTI